MTDVWSELAPDILAETIANEQRDLVRAFEASRPRSQQQAIGPSGIGSPCTRCLARKVLDRPVIRGWDDPWRRIVGTAIHSWLQEAALHRNKELGRDRYVLEARVYPDGPASDLLPSGGDCDLYDRDLRLVLDHKTTTPAKIKDEIKVNGPSEQYKYQAHLYARGMEILGNPVEHVCILFWPRDGVLSQVYPYVEPYDEAVAIKALDRYRTIRALALSLGTAVLPTLPADKSCWDCRGADVTPEELA